MEIESGHERQQNQTETFGLGKSALVSLNKDVSPRSALKNGKEKRLYEKKNCRDPFPVKRMYRQSCAWD